VDIITAVIIMKKKVMKKKMMKKEIMKKNIIIKKVGLFGKQKKSTKLGRYNTSKCRR
jgi:hypothetical protein